MLLGWTRFKSLNGFADGAQFFFAGTRLVEELSDEGTCRAAVGPQAEVAEHAADGGVAGHVGPELEGTPELFALQEPLVGHDGHEAEDRRIGPAQVLFAKDGPDIANGEGAVLPENFENLQFGGSRMGRSRARHGRVEGKTVALCQTSDGNVCPPVSG